MPTTTPHAAQRIVGEHAIAEVLRWSVHTVRKDRTGKRRIPYFKIGGSVRYDLDRVRDALQQYEQGGPPVPKRGRA